VPSHKIVQFELTEVVREGLVDGKTQDAILEDLNTELVIRHDKKKGKPPSISKAALERYLSSIPEQTVAALHGSRLATANAELALDFGARFKERMVTLDTWLTEVSEAHRYITVNNEQVDLGPDWQARKAMMSEERRWLQLYADLMERIYNAEQVRLFQASVIDALREADPEIARKVEQALRDATEKRAAALLGMAA
jgi:hypothetical protein